MTKPEVVRCPDHHFRCVLWGLAPYIITRSNWPLLVLCSTGVHGMWLTQVGLSIYLLFNFVYRCRALPNNLDGPESSDRRSRAHTDFLIGKCELSVLYKDYGIIGNVVVCIQTIWIQFFSYSFYFQPFTNDFPWADIHELITPDLLHQLIKGVFKDHLVTWVNNYLEKTHGKKKAKEILDDIDHR